MNTQQGGTSCIVYSSLCSREAIGFEKHLQVVEKSSFYLQ